MFSENYLAEYGALADEDCEAGTEVANSVPSRQGGAFDLKLEDGGNKTKNANRMTKQVKKRQSKTAQKMGHPQGVPLSMERWVLQVYDLESGADT